MIKKVLQKSHNAVPCVHHWLLSTPTYAFDRPDAEGSLIETTNQTCKKCQEIKVNTVVVPYTNEDVMREEDEVPRPVRLPLGIHIANSLKVRQPVASR